MTVYDAIVLRLSEKRGGNTLPAKAIKTTAKYLSENVGLEDAQEFSFLDLPCRRAARLRLRVGSRQAQTVRGQF